MIHRNPAAMLAMGTLMLAALCGSGAARAADSAPRMPDGHPDLNGTWDNGGGIDFLQPKQLPGGSVCVTGCASPPTAGAPASPPTGSARQGPDRPRYKPEFQAKVKDLDTRQLATDPVLRCQPPGVPRIGPPDKIVQTRREIIFLYEDVSGPFFRIVPMDGRKVADDSETYLGNARGQWDGDTLVVESRNFNDETWLAGDGSFHTTGLTVTERLRRSGDTIDYSAVADDPKVLVEPWKLRPRRMTLSAEELAEPAPCVEQDLEHIVDGSHHDNPR